MLSKSIKQKILLLQAIFIISGALTLLGILEVEKSTGFHKISEIQAQHQHHFEQALLRFEKEDHIEDLYHIAQNTQRSTKTCFDHIQDLDIFFLRVIGKSKIIELCKQDQINDQNIFKKIQAYKKGFIAKDEILSLLKKHQTNIQKHAKDISEIISDFAHVLCQSLITFVFFVIIFGIAICLLITKKIRDLSDQLISTQDQLSHRTHELESILSNIQEAVIVSDMNFNFNLFNKEAKRILGKNITENNKNWTRDYSLFDIHGHKMQHDDLPLVRAIKKSEIIHNHHMICETSKGPIEVSINASPIYIQNKQIGAVLSFRDVTIRSRLQREIEQQKQYLTDILDFAPDPILITDCCGTINSINQATSKITKFSAHELSNKKIHHLFDRQHTQQLHHIIEKSQSIHKACLLEKDHKITLISKDNKKYSTHLSASIIYKGATRKIAFLIKDLSEILKIQDHLQKSNQQLEEFAYITSHDLQEPIRTIQGYTQMIYEQIHPVLNEEQRHDFSYIFSATQRMRALISDLLIYSRIGHQNTSKKDISLHDIFLNVRNDLQAAIDECQASFSIHLTHQITGSPQEIQLLFQNMISNAIKFRSTERNCHIKIHSYTEDSFLKITFTDNGIGIDPKYFTKIFKVFQRLHTQEELPGTGIGLSICQKIVKNHQGFISVNSHHDKTIFTVILPLSCVVV